MPDSNFLEALNKDFKNKLRLLNEFSAVGINWFRLKRLRQLSGPGIKHTSFLGKKFKFREGNEFLHAVKEVFLEEPYKLTLQHQPYIIDCGANIGLSILYLKQQYPEAEILAFEPDNTNFEILKENIETYKLKKVELRKEAVWCENGQLHFHNSGSMSSKVVETGLVDTVTVNAFRLRDALIRQVDFLKLDIEGAEYRVLTDSKDRLDLVKNLFIEYHGNFDNQGQFREMLHLLEMNGFHYYIKEAASVYDHPFTRKNKINSSFDIQLNLFCFRKEI